MKNNTLLSRQSETQFSETFDNFYQEVIKNNTPVKLSDLKKEIKKLYPDTIFSVIKYNNYLYLNKILVRDKNKGIGKAILTRLCAFCDINNINLKLYPTNNFGSNFDRLIEFYYNFGFTFECSVEMIRKPVCKNW